MNLWTVMACAGLAAGLGGDGLPRELWRYEALSNLYAPPLVAEMNDTPGREIVIADSEARRLRCISASGEPLWECDGGWSKRLISPAALSDVGADGSRRLAMGNGDGSLVCVNAANGTVLWRREVGTVEWGGALWARISGTDEQSIVIATEHDGVAAFTADGDAIWHTSADAAETPLHIRGPLAACDISGNGRAELFGASRFGVFCLDADGNLLWEHNTGDDFPGGVIVADADRDGFPELYAASYDDAYLWRFDATTGQPVWKAPLYGKVDVYSASSIAVGDITGNGVDEIVLGDAVGHVHAFRADGQLLWSFKTAKPIHIAVSLGDVTGNGMVDILAASGDHHLYCLDGQGRLQWRFKTGLRLIYPPTLADLDGRGQTDILVCGSDRHLRRLTLGGRYSSSLMPWPSRRFDAHQGGASFGLRPEAPPLVKRSEPLAIHGDFEQGKVRDGLEQFDRESPFYALQMARPRGWRSPTLGATRYGISELVAYSGTHALHVEEPMVLLSEAQQCPPTLRSLSASVYASGEGAMGATLRWLGDHGLIREDPLAPGAREGDWTRFERDALSPPPGARRVVMALVTESAPVFWDAATLTAAHEEVAAFTVLVNQAGYDTGAPKRFVAQANFLADERHFAVTDAAGVVFHEGRLEYAGRIQGHYGNDWGHEYYTGDFSALDAPGSYRVRVDLDGLTEHSWPIEIGEQRLWTAAARPAYRFFYYQRCGMAIPGYYAACHLDDAASPDGKTHYDLWGGWHDAGDYNKYHNAPYVYGLALAYSQSREAFDALGESTPGVSEFFDEILWGGDHVRRMVMEDGSAFGHITSGYGYWGPPDLETDNIPGTGDERRGSRERGDNPDAHQAALAHIAVLLGGQDGIGEARDVWVETAARSLDYALDEGRRGLWQLSTAIDLYAATGETRYRALAETLREELIPEDLANFDIGVMHIETMKRYDAVFGAAHAERLAPAVRRKAAAMLAQADNPFGVYTFGPPDRPNFFNTPADQGGWHVGTSSYLLEAAAFMALAFHYDRDPRLLRFVYDQFNWTLGMNPYNISLMEGVGSAFAPSYHHRYVFAGAPRGAVPGGVVNGITWRAVRDDRPSFDMSGVDIPAYESNEVWLPHNTAFLNALVQLTAAREKS